MKSIGRVSLLSVVVVLFVIGSIPGTTLAGNNPVDEGWWPSEFGPEDEAGAVNYITPEKRVAAAGLVKKGMTATLGMPYYNGMPLVPGRTFALSIPGGGTPTHGPFSWPGENYDMTFMDEILTAEIGQVGSQWDGLGHPLIRVQGVEGWEDGNYFYNRFRLEDVGNPRGLKKVGTEHVANVGFFTRGILIDIAALKGTNRLDKGYAVTMADYQAALEAQGIDDADVGDVVLVRTGWNSLWKDYNAPAAERAANNAEHGSGEPGLSPEVCDHLADKKDRHGRVRHLGPGGHRAEHPDRVGRLLPHEPHRAARHHQFRKPGPGRPVTGKGLRVPVYLVAAQADRRYRFAGQPDCRLVRPEIVLGAGRRAGSVCFERVSADSVEESL